MANIKKITVYVKGMHCPSCEILMNDKFREEKNVVDVKPDFHKQKVDVFYKGKFNQRKVNKKIGDFGYKIVDHDPAEREPLSKRFFESFGIASVLVFLYLIAKDLSLIPNFNFNSNLNFFSIFAIGLVASTSTCMATAGALFLSTIGKERNNFIQAVNFNLGRIVSYGVFGFIVGAVGQTLATTLKIGPWLTLLTAFFMIMLGLDMAGLLSFASIIPYGKTKGVFEKVEGLFIKNPKKTSFMLGAITYLLPCGFTQAIQVYALGLASPLKSSLTMIVFVLGTVPAMLFIGVVGSFTKNKFYPVFLRTMGMMVFIIGLSYFSNFVNLAGINFWSSSNPGSSTGNQAVVENGEQIIEMNVNNRGYEPAYFTVKNNIPVKWKINGENAFGCQSYLVIPKLGVQKTIQSGENIITFTPKETGLINFSCAMGMYRGTIEVI